MDLRTGFRIRYGKLTKRFPPLFDASKRLWRLLGSSDLTYKCLKEFARNRQAVTFLQIGSNDGISQDPLREFIVKYPNWEGCLVEPLPHLFEKLRKNYSHLGRNNLRYVNAAVSDSGGKINLYRIRDDYHNEFPTFVDQIASVSRSHLASVCPDDPGINEKIETIQAKKMSITELMGSFPKGGLNLLHLDVEGHESVILRNFPFHNFRPEVVIFEEGHLSVEDAIATRSLLRAKGYTVFDSGIDAVALSKTAPDGCREALSAN